LPFSEQPVRKNKTLGADAAYRAARPNVHTRHWGRESDKRDRTNVYKSVELHVIPLNMYRYLTAWLEFLALG